MLRELPHLEFLAIKDLIIHEWHDDQRTPPLIRRIRESGLWRNPPIVAPLEDGTQRYMVLDGANRFTALKEMDFHHILVQVVQPDSPGLRLHTWNHVVWDISMEAFTRGIQAIPATELVLADANAIPDLMGDCGLALIQFPGEEHYSLCTEAEALILRVETLNALVNSYKKSGHLDRTSVREISQLKTIYANLAGLVIFPNFNIRDVLYLAGAGYLLPTGITRFTIAPRALHLNYPLHELAADRPVEEKNAQLRQWIQQRIASKGIRYYAEPTFLFDE
jgi:hypothetical protein